MKIEIHVADLLDVLSGRQLKKQKQKPKVI